MENRWGDGPIKFSEEEEQKRRVRMDHEEERRRKTDAWLAGSSCLLLPVVLSFSPTCLFIWLWPTNLEVFFSLLVEGCNRYLSL